MLYLNSVETESLTGPEAVSKATKCTLSLNPRPVATVVHFKVSSQGITLTDNKRRCELDTVPVTVSTLVDLFKFDFFFLQFAKRKIKVYSNFVSLYAGCFSGDTIHSAVSHLAVLTLKTRGACGGKKFHFEEVGEQNLHQGVSRDQILL